MPARLVDLEQLADPLPTSASGMQRFLILSFVKFPQTGVRSVAFFEC
jgi:hypothetical protein